ncbi:MAG: choice-of-anchor P family protein [Gaiellaceae bacterium]
MARRLALSTALVFTVLTAVSAGASSSGKRVEPAASASAYAVSIVAPGAAAVASATASAPPDAASVGPGFSHPADGSIVRTGVLSASAFASAPSTATANAAGDVSSLSIFNGEITADGVTARVRSTADSKAASGDFSGARVTGLQALGQAVAGVPGTTVALADWGTLTVLAQTATPSTTRGLPGHRTAAIALQVHLAADHGGLPAGSDIFVGYAEATVQAGTPPAAAIPTPSSSSATPATKPETSPKDAKPQGPVRAPGLSIRPPRKAPPDVHPPLTAGGYVFPVYGAVSWIDTFGGPRAAPVGWHHGVDIFAQLGQPILAVADGELFSVGWNDIGGLRLWLRDSAGNEFYYAHLSALSTRAVNGAQVQAGEVIGFIGNTGDAEGTPPHLHFEIHPVSMLYQGYDGAVNPTNYLLAWEKLKDVPITGVAGWALPLGIGSAAPKPGAILLQAIDISSASGLDPASLRRALRGPGSAVVDGSLAGFRARATRPPASRPLRRGSAPPGNARRL